MKSFKNLIVIMIITLFTFITFANPLFPVVKSGKWGFIDKTGNLVIKNQFKDAKVFTDGLAPVKFRNNKWGYIDETGKTVIEGQFLDAHFFEEGIATVLEYRKRNPRMLYIDKTGKQLFEEKFVTAKPFREGFAPVQTEKNGWKFIDKTGKTVLDNDGFGYQDAGVFSEGLAAVFGGKGKDMKSYRYYYIDNTGKEAVTLPTGKIMGVSKFSEGKAAIMLNRKWGYINKKGDYVIESKFDFAHDFHDGIAAVHIDANKWAFIKDDGTPLNDKYWTGAGWAPQFYGNYWEPIRAKLQQASSVGHMLFGGSVPMFNASLIIDIDDKKAVPYFKEGWAPMLLHVNTRKREALFGYVDKDGNRLDEKKKYNLVWPFKNGLAKVRLGKGDKYDRFGYIDVTGKEIWKPTK